MSNSKIQALIDRLMELAAQPEVLFLIVVGAPLIFFVSTSRKYRWWLIGFWAFCLPLTPFNDWLGNWTPPPFPIDKLVFNGRHIALFLLLAMLPAAFHSRKFNDTIRIPAPLVGLFIVNMIFCIRYLPTEHASIAFVRLATYCCVFYMMAVSLPKRIGDQQDLMRFLKASAYSVLLVVGFGAICYFLRPDSVVKNGRMAGLTSNPNFLGSLCGLSLPVFLGLVLLPNQSYRHKLFWIVATAFVLIILGWTGSRTAMGMAGIAVLVIFRTKIGSFLIVGIPLVGVVLGLGAIFKDSHTAAGRLMSLGDTRSGIWTTFYEQWRHNPIFGNSDLGMRTVENSYLVILANTGIVGSLAMLFFLVLSARTCFTLLRMNTLDPTMKILRDIALSGILAALGGAFFIGFLVSSLSSDAYWIFLYFILAEVVQNFAARNESLNWYQAFQAQYQSLAPAR